MIITDNSNYKKALVIFIIKKMDRPNSSSTEPWSLLGNKIPK